MIINHKKTKIVATLGPASDNKETMLAMVRAGVNVFRINMSHATPQEIHDRTTRVREINKEFGTNISILADLQGPKLRVGIIKEGTVVKPGDVITFTNTPCEGDATRAYMTYENFARDAKVGERILLDDGKLVFDVIESNKKDEVKAVVVQGGPFKSKKGVNLPNTKISLPALTEKDIRDVKTAVEFGTDWFALSFVRSAKDVQDLQDLIATLTDRKIPIISKIEKPEAVEDIENILAVTDAIMVARGDLGIEVPAESVPLIQKDLVKRARAFARPVIIATQMMESMMTSMNPARSDVNDVANSVIDGADAVMLSGETSVGDYPVEVIQQMTKIIKAVESYRLGRLPKHPPMNYTSDRYITDAICYHASEIAFQMKAKALTTITNTGYTAYKLSSHRPDSHILVFTNNREIMTQLNLVWGCRAFYLEAYDNTDDVVVYINEAAKKRDFVRSGDEIINLLTTPPNGSGKVNSMRINIID